jgi:LysM repeat protein
LNVRSQPSDSGDSKRLKSLRCNEVVDLTGRYVPINNPERDWYQIRLTDETGNPMLGWVIANRVSVPAEDQAKLPLLDYSGLTVTPAPQPQGTTLAPGTAQNSTPGNCIYTVKTGDVLSIIAQKFGVTDAKNITCKQDSPGCNLSDPNKIDAGWQLIVPGVTSETCTQQGGEPAVN